MTFFLCPEDSHIYECYTDPWEEWHK